MQIEITTREERARVLPGLLPAYHQAIRAQGHGEPTRCDCCGNTIDAAQPWAIGHRVYGERVYVCQPSCLWRLQRVWAPSPRVRLSTGQRWGHKAPP